MAATLEDRLLAPITHQRTNRLRSGKASGTSYTTPNFTKGGAGDAAGV